MSELTDRIARKHFERGRMFELQDKIEEAIAAYRDACALKPGYAEPYFFLGRLEATSGQCDDALEALNRALTFGDDPEIVEWRGYVYGRLQRYEDALADYQSAIPGGAPGVRVNAGRMLLALGRYDEAEEMLHEADEPSAVPLLDALPRYREFIEPVGRGGGRGARIGRDPVDDARAVRYLFGATVVLGSLGDTGRDLALPRYTLLTYQHCACTIGRLIRLCRDRKWQLDGVAGQGTHHGPVAQAVAALLELPLVEPGGVTPGQRVLLCHGIVNGPDEAQALRRPFQKGGAETIQFAVGFVPSGDPSRSEPDIIGMPAQCAVEWYRVEPWSRLVHDETVKTGEHKGFRVGPAFFDGNSAKVTQSLLDACRRAKSDPAASPILEYYRRHAQVRAFGNVAPPISPAPA